MAPQGATSSRGLGRRTLLEHLLAHLVAIPLIGLATLSFVAVAIVGGELLRLFVLRLITRVLPPPHQAPQETSEGDPPA